MKINHNKRFDETIFNTTLENGLSVIIVHKPEFRNHVALLGTNFGAKQLHQIVNGNDVVFNSGVAHFLEHKLFEKQDEDILSTFTNMGASANAFTSYNETVYYFSTTQQLELPLNTLLDFVMDLSVTEQGVTKEKGIIIEELKMYQEMPLFRLSMEVLESLFVHHPLKHDIAGTVESVNAITKEELEQAYFTNYHPSQLVLSIVSPTTPEKIVEIIQKNQKEKGSTNQLEVINPKIDEPQEVARPFHKILMNVNNPKIALAYKQSLPFKDQLEAYKANVMMQMILDLNFSKLNPDYQSWIDANLINDLFVYQSDFGLDYGYFEFIAETQLINEFKSFISDKLENLEILPEKLLQLKKRYLGENISDLSDFESFAINNFRAHFVGSNPFELIELIESITESELQNFISDLSLENKVEVLLQNS